MATPSEKLAESLEALRKLQQKGIVAIQARDLTRTHRERLCKNGFLFEVIKGWYVPTHPEERPGDSTAWYASFWEFCAAYLNKRFGNKWCLSPEQSVAIHAGSWTVPKQLLVRSPKGSNKVTPLLYGTSLLDTRNKIPASKEIKIEKGMRVFSLPAALVYSTPKIFSQSSSDTRAVLATIRDPSELLSLLLEGGHTAVASRLVGAFYNIGRDQIANEIINTMSSAGYDVREKDPFEEKSGLIFSSRERSPYVARMQIMWQEMRKVVIDHFPKPLKHRKDIKTYIRKVEETYITDAYHSLSIEGYRVTPELIQHVKSGKWNPEKNDSDKDHISALAARGYWQAFQVVKDSIRKVLKKENPGDVVEEDHRNWYREMFSPSVSAGILKPSDLSGYRNHPVYIRRSMHVPPNSDAVRDLMPTFCELLRKETNEGVRVVLGHFFFVYIHPYMDGNGRIGRFLMNVMLAAGGYPWIVIPIEKRNSYMSALEEASVRQNIKPFNDFLAELIRYKLRKNDR